MTYNEIVLVKIIFFHRKDGRERFFVISGNTELLPYFAHSIVISCIMSVMILDPGIRQCFYICRIIYNDITKVFAFAGIVTEKS